MRIALITGASGGIGKSLCSEFLSAGYEVIAVDLVQPTQGKINIQLDLLQFVRDEHYCNQIVFRLREAIPERKLHALVNNAAIQILEPLESLSKDDFLKSQDINVTAPFLLTQALLKELEAAKGSVINIGSIHSHLTKPHFIAYSTSKAGLLGLTQAMAVEIGSRVRVNSISPAAVHTPMLRAGFENQPSEFEKLKSFHPVMRIGEPEEIAKLAVFLASDQCTFINGSNMSINGGIGARLHDPS